MTVYVPNAAPTASVPDDEEDFDSGDDDSFLVNSRSAIDSGLRPKQLFRNLCPARLYEHAVRYEPDVSITSSGALAACSGAKTGRSPGDKRIVRDGRFDVWWGGPESPNLPMDTRTFLANREAAVDFLNVLPRVYLVDGFACWEPSCRMKVRAVLCHAYHALVMTNMLIRPTEQELEEFGEPDFVIYNGGPFPANKYVDYMTSSTSINISLAHKEMVILGTCYAGEMKKGIFTLLHYYLPQRDALFLHSGCNIGAAGDVTLFFGLSGTGKTTLSSDPNRPLIGDDEHCWAPSGVFNIEGGCYAKVIGITPEADPDIFAAAARFGVLLENVTFDPVTRDIDFADSSLTENTRASYPIQHFRNAHIPCVGGHARNVILLCCDAFGVLPPVSKLSLGQALYHFVSGYTAKVAGTEQGVAQPQATFSACYAGAFIMWHPMKYAALLADKMQKHGTTAWLVNTGWTGGSCGSGGRRISVKFSRAILDAIHSGELAAAEFTKTPIFGLQVPRSCSGVPPGMLVPESQWRDSASYQATLIHLATMFVSNFAVLTTPPPAGTTGGDHGDTDPPGSGSSWHYNNYYGGPGTGSLSRFPLSQELQQQILEGGPRLPPAAAATAAAILYKHQSQQRQQSQQRLLLQSRPEHPSSSCAVVAYASSGMLAAEAAAAAAAAGDLMMANAGWSEEPRLGDESSSASAGESSVESSPAAESAASQAARGVFHSLSL